VKSEREQQQASSESEDVPEQREVSSDSEEVSQHPLPVSEDVEMAETEDNNKEVFFKKKISNKNLFPCYQTHCCIYLCRLLYSFATCSM
jgi:hypothetical protein